MKKQAQIIFAVLMTMIMSCDFGKNSSPDHSTEGRTVPENEEITNTTNYKKTGNLDAVDEASIGNNQIADSLNENWNLDNPKRRENLYSRFQMTQEQIQRYEKALQTWKESQKNDAYKLLSANEKIKEENRILKDILNDSQYKQYRQWAKANDLTRTKYYLNAVCSLFVFFPATHEMNNLDPRVRGIK
ncbi:hypothetical protein [Gelidibacter salicanalis]|uniref:Lipoprotein n=1 Tax=Gelidibacter salicanalis TaxID=291193 RepID=A0A934KTP9_9FLAO|nr:hypothetical protein [Gelidibacter salicanalis]MBJ7880527.1 hypothetical protein [Gelidibacter salicanalis]